MLFAGTPSIAVRLGDDGRDVVTVEDVLNFDVPRRDTVAVVDAVLGGRVRLEGAGVGRLTRRSRLFGSAFVTVRVADDRSYRVHCRCSRGARGSPRCASNRDPAFG